MKKETLLIIKMSMLIVIGITISTVITALQFGKLAGVMSENSQMRVERQELAIKVLKQQQILQDIFDAQQAEAKRQAFKKNLTFPLSDQP